MPRPRKDPNLRKNDFIAAARQLFFTNGYEGTAIQDILQAVGERSASPSVFYYYFSSKEDIYHAVMENYIAEYLDKLESYFHESKLSVEDRIVKVMIVFIETLSESKTGIDTADSMSNRLFALDLRERITRHIMVMWEAAISDLPWIKHSDTHIKSLAQYITGGICEMIYDFVFEQDAEQQNIKALTKEIIDYSATILNTPKLIRKRLVEKVEKIT